MNYMNLQVITEVNTKEEIISNYFDGAMVKLSEMIASFDDHDFNKIPFEGSWTAGQVAEHVYKSISDMPSLLLTETKEAGRDIFEKCEAIGAIFLNFDVKLKSPDFILPTNEPKQVSAFVDGFSEKVNEISKAMKQVDLSRLYTRFQFPTIGELTGWEWIYFAAAHSTRHTLQMKKIRERLQA
jgi:hypothetical protein